MSILPSETFQSVLESALLEANLPATPIKIIGKSYLFCAEHGSHHFILAGTVTGIYLSDEAGIGLEVSNKQIWGRPLKCLVNSDGEWTACMDIAFPKYADPKMQAEAEERHWKDAFIKGKFTLLDDDPPQNQFQGKRAVPC